MSQTKTSNKELVSIITASSVGTLIEWYDFYIFGSLATIISTQFFPNENPVAAFLATLATYAAGLVVRPFGALIFGRLGDLIGRKYTFMVTLLLMGGSTFAIGLIPKYETIGFWAPLIVLVLRLLQGLAIGGEYGGATTFVAEHSPLEKRGFWTSWIQITAIMAFVISLGVILITKSLMDEDSWSEWGWRIPFLISIFMVAISVYIRRNLAESPLFTQAKVEGKTSINPLKESFGNKANLKVVLLALFGITMGLGAASWASVLYVQTFLLKFMFIDYNQVNSIIIIGLLLGVGFNILFGWLSDSMGRKWLIMLSLFLAIISFRPIYEKMHDTCKLDHKIETLAALTVEKNSDPLITNSTDTLITTKTQHFYTDGTILSEVKKEIISSGEKGKPEITQSIKINVTDKWTLIFLVFLLELITTMAYGPLAAYLVEMFPLKIRYSSMSLPYHVGFGIFGGMSPVIATYLIEKAKVANTHNYYLAGLTYPILIMCVALIIGLIYLKEKGDFTYQRSIHTKYWNKVKQYLGFIWIGLGMAAAYYGIFKFGLPKINTESQDDFIFGLIILIFITPIASGGLLLFGKYALQGDYDE